MDEMLTVLLGALLFLGVFAVFWQAIVWIIGRVGGWSRLAQEFATTRQPYGRHFSWATIYLGSFSRYRSAVNLWVSDDGLFMQPTFLFRAGHARLLIPWEAFEQCKQRDVWFYSHLTCALLLADGSRRRLTLYSRQVADAVRSRLNGESSSMG